MKWALETPTKPGLYWLYGDPHAQKASWGTKHVRLYIVKVSEISNGHMYVCDGAFVSPKSFVFPVLWQRIYPPKPDPMVLWQDVMEALGLEVSDD